MPGTSTCLRAIGLIAAVLFWPLGVAADPGTMTVYKTASCGCCTGWIQHIRSHGFDVTARDVDFAELARIKSHYRVPVNVHSCHTAVVDGYVVEGHVPSDVLARLLQERPAVIGISAPGMPAASPGMDIPDGGPYNVVTFDANGAVQLYQRVE